MEETSKPNHVIVTVDAEGIPICTPPALPVTSCDAWLHFDLQADGYIFPDDGKAVVVAAPGTQFPYPSETQVGNKKVKLFDKNTERGGFTYTVAVKNVKTGELRSHDPTIINEP